MSSSYAPFTGFGDAPNFAAKFSIEHPGTEFAQWQSDAGRPTFDIPNPSGGPIRRVSQSMGRFPWVVSWTLWFDTIAEYEFMDAMVNTRATLRYIWGTTATVGGTVQTISGVQYLVLPDTLLVSLGRPVIAVDGTVEVVATFERQYVAPPIPTAPTYPEPPYPLAPLNSPLSVMANPPTITTGAANAATVISGSSLKAMSNIAFTYGGCRTGAGSTFPNNGYYSPANIAATDGSKTLYVASNWYAEFEFDGAELEVLVKGTGAGSRLRCTVDGEGFSSVGGVAGPPSDGNTYLIHHDFGDAKIRRIRFDFAANTFFGGIRIPPGTLLTPTARDQGPKVIIAGDSFTEGSNADAQFSAFGDMLGQRMGWLDVTMSGWGSTGYLNDHSGTRTTLRTRLVKDIINHFTGFAGPKVLMVALGLNDHLLYSAAAIQAEADLVFAQVKAAIPDIELIVADLFWPRGTGVATSQQAIDAIRAAAAPHESLHIRTMGGPRPYSGNTTDYTNMGWWTGTGYVGNEQGDGNSDIYTSSDGTHPTQAGHDMIGTNSARRIAAALPALVQQRAFVPPIPWTPSTYEEAILFTSGLHSYWRLDEVSGVTAADELGVYTSTTQNITHAQTGVLVGDTSTSYGLNGTNARARTNVFGLSTTTYSIEGWFRNTRSLASAASMGFLLSVGAGTSHDAVGIRGTTGTSGAMYVSDGTTVYESSKITTENTWYHVVLVRNGTNVKLYVDGVEVLDTTFAATYGTDRTVTIGAQSNSFSWFQGNADEVATYNAALSAATIVQHYQYGTGVLP